MASIKEIYAEIFEGKRLTIHVADEKQFNSLRVSLQKEHSMMKAVDLTDLALCADYLPEKSAGVYWIGESRRIKKMEFQIIEVTDAAPETETPEIPETLGDNSSIGPSNPSEVSEGISQDADTSSQEGESKGQRA